MLAKPQKFSIVKAFGLNTRKPKLVLTKVKAIHARDYIKSNFNTIRSKVKPNLT